MLTRAGTCTTAIEAHLLRMRLETEGIAAWLRYEHHIGADWTKSLALGGVQLRVAAADRERALAVIAGHERGDYALDPQEPACPRCSWKAALLAAHLFSLPLPFRWALARCPRCRHEWDLPDTRAYPWSAIVLAAAAAAVLLTGLTFAALCFDSTGITAIFPATPGGCR